METFLQYPLQKSQQRWLVSLGIWLFALIITPIGIWVYGDDSFPLTATFGVLAHTTTTIIALSLRWSWKEIVQAFMIVAILTWLAEYIGSTTGYPFGDYEYTDLLQPQIGHVPLLIPLAWFMMLPPAWAIAHSLLGENPKRWQLAALTGLTFTAWDLYLDPQMVAKELWLWENPSGYFGIPWINFFGWWLVSSIVTFVIFPKKLPQFELLMIYTLTAMFQLVGLGIFWGQPAPAVIGFFAMGGVSILAWQQWRQKGSMA